VPYGQEAKIGPGLVEVFTRGAFSGTDPNKIPFTARHPDSGDTLPIGPTLELRDDAAGLVGRWRVSKTSFGDDVLELIRDRALTGLSVGFKELAHGTSGTPSAPGSSAVPRCCITSPPSPSLRSRTPASWPSVASGHRRTAACRC
jgi:HK97 family phage prohead protease